MSGPPGRRIGQRTGTCRPSTHIGHSSGPDIALPWDLLPRVKLNRMRSTPSGEETCQAGPRNKRQEHQRNGCEWRTVMLKALFIHHRTIAVFIKHVGHSSLTMSSESQYWHTCNYSGIPAMCCGAQLRFHEVQNCLASLIPWTHPASSSIDLALSCQSIRLREYLRTEKCTPPRLRERLSRWYHSLFSPLRHKGRHRLTFAGSLFHFANGSSGANASPSLEHSFLSIYVLVKNRGLPRMRKGCSCVCCARV